MSITLDEYLTNLANAVAERLPGQYVKQTPVDESFEVLPVIDEEVLEEWFGDQVDPYNLQGKPARDWLADPYTIFDKRQHRKYIKRLRNPEQRIYLLGIYLGDLGRFLTFQSLDEWTQEDGFRDTGRLAETCLLTSISILEFTLGNWGLPDAIEEGGDATWDKISKWHLGVLYRYIGSYEESVHYLEKAVEDTSGFSAEYAAEVYTELAFAYLLTNDSRYWETLTTGLSSHRAKNFRNIILAYFLYGYGCCGNDIQQAVHFYALVTREKACYPYSKLAPNVFPMLEAERNWCISKFILRLRSTYGNIDRWAPEVVMTGNPLAGPHFEEIKTTVDEDELELLNDQRETLDAKIAKAEEALGLTSLHSLPDEGFETPRIQIPTENTLTPFSDSNEDGKVDSNEEKLLTIPLMLHHAPEIADEFQSSSVEDEIARLEKEKESIAKRITSLKTAQASTSEERATQLTNLASKIFETKWLVTDVPDAGTLTKKFTEKAGQRLHGTEAEKLEKRKHIIALVNRFRLKDGPTVFFRTEECRAEIDGKKVRFVTPGEGSHKIGTALKWPELTFSEIPKLPEHQVG